jgi:2-phospho-L-lactate guanylyltransferase
VTVAVAVPVRDFATAKQRLAPVLDPAERSALARAMLEDVLAALAGAPLDAPWVVTGDAEVEAVARHAGAEVLREATSDGHTEAVARAQALAATRGADLFLTVPGDVPAVTAEEIGIVVAAAARPRAAVFVPSRSGDGTNAALLRPPLAMPLKFGEPSFANHVTSARGHELSAVTLVLPGLGLDVDTPEDLRLLVTMAPGTRSGRLLAAWDVGGRLAAARRSGGAAPARRAEDR